MKPDQSSLESYQKRSRTLYTQGNFKGCVEECDRAIGQGWKDGGIYNIKAVALTQLQQYDEAMNAINMAIKLDPDNTKFTKNKGIIKAKMINTSPQKSNIDPTLHQKEKPTNQDIPHQKMSIVENLIKSFEFAKDGIVGHWERWIALMVLSAASVIGDFFFLFSIASLFTSTIILGYEVKIYEGGDFAPELGGLSEMFVDGIQCSIIYIIYLIIPLMVLFVGILFLGVGFIGMEVKDVVTELMDAGLGGTMAIGLIVTLIGVVLFYIFYLLAVFGCIRFAKTGRLGEGLNFGEILETMGNIGWGYLIASFIVCLLIGVISAFIVYIPFLGIVLLFIMEPFFLLWRAKFFENLYSCTQLSKYGDLY